MILIIMSVRDRVADVFGQPFYVVSRGSAIRGFADEINRVDGANQLNKHPDDFDLYELGTFSDGDAVFMLHDKPQQVAIGKDMVVRNV